jgi:hypothetical protein
MDSIADKITKALVASIDGRGHGPVLPLTMMVSVRSKYGRHRLVVLVEHLAVVLQARLRHNSSSRFNDDTGTNSIMCQPASVGTRHRGVDAWHQDAARTRRRSGRTRGQSCARQRRQG